MKFLHTGDWHLGRTLYSESLLEDQRHFLKNVSEELKNAQKNAEPYDCLFISGDVYDRAIPSVGAVLLFDDFLTALATDFPRLHVFVTAGNHDGAERLSFASRFLEKSNIHLCFGTEHLSNAVIVDSCAIYQIPFLMPGSFKDGAEKSQRALFERATAEIREAHQKNFPTLPSVVLAHATVFGENNDEKNQIGTAESISPSLFDGFSYVALGHIHSFKKITERMYYSGSPLSYTFDDVSKKVMICGTIKIDNSLSIKTIPIEPLRPVVRLKGAFSDFYNADESETKKYEQCLVEIKCTDEQVVQMPKALLETKFPHLLSFSREKATSTKENSDFVLRRNLIERRNEASHEEFFSTFLSELYGNDLNEDDAKAETELFLKFLNENLD